MQAQTQFFHPQSALAAFTTRRAGPMTPAPTLSPATLPALHARWTRARPWLGAAATLLALALGAALALGRAPFTLIWLYLLTLCLLPACWPRTFGRWAALWVLLLAGIAPGLLVRAGLLPAHGPTSVYTGLLLALLGIWAMLPATLLLLLVRRYASMALTLLAGAALPPALLALILATGLAPVPDVSSPGKAVQLFAAFTPFAAVTLACCLGPVYFAASLLWLVAKETRGDP